MGARMGGMPKWGAVDLSMDLWISWRQGSIHWEHWRAVTQIFKIDNQCFDTLSFLIPLHPLELISSVDFVFVYHRRRSSRWPWACKSNNAFSTSTKRLLRAQTLSKTYLVFVALSINQQSRLISTTSKKGAWRRKSRDLYPFDFAFDPTNFMFAHFVPFAPFVFKHLFNQSIPVLHHAKKLAPNLWP